MAIGAVEVTVAASADATWKVVGDFGGVAAFVPDLESFRLEGDDRIVGMFGMEVRERLLSRDAEARTLTYSVLGPPIESHRATISVEPNGEGSKVTWTYEVTPDEMEPILRGIYKRALASLAHAIAE
jgi:mxaD protein